MGEIAKSIQKLQEQVTEAEAIYKRKMAIVDMEIRRLQSTCKHADRGRKRTCPECGAKRGTKR